MDTSIDNSQLQQIYSARFAGQSEYRNQVWRVLAPYFGQWIPANGSVLDLGAGYCEFINNCGVRQRYAMDFNPDVNRQAAPGVEILLQDCSQPWQLPASSLDAVFTSNFLEHLPHKAAVRDVLLNAFECLKPGGALIAMGPNIKYLAGQYWDFFDHYVELSETSLAEALSTCGFVVEKKVPRFLPYTMSHGRKYPVWILSQYLNMPFAWPLFGKQFLVVARKPR